MFIAIIIAATIMFVAGITSLTAAIVTRITDNDTSYRIAMITMWVMVGMNVVVQALSLCNLLAA